VLRSLRALLLFWTVFASYGWTWLVTRPFGQAARDRAFARAHLTNARRLSHGFMRLGGVFIKVGQVLSVVGTFLPSAFCEVLQELQDKVPPRPFREIEARLREALGPSALDRFERFDEHAIAAASLAQVHRAVTRDRRAVAVKVLYPGIEALIRRDLAVLRSLLPVVKRLFPISRFERVLDELGAMLNRETDYAHERANMERLRSVFQDRKNVTIPGVVDELTHGAVLTMTFEEGIKITDVEAQARAGLDPEATARLLVECYFAMLLEHRIFHADPHPGNFLVRPWPDGGPELVILDFGAVEEVTDALADGMREVIMGVLSKDDERILKGLGTMGFVAPDGDRELLRRVGRDYLRVLAEVPMEDLGRIDRSTVQKLGMGGYSVVRGRLREVMRSVEYPRGYFYVERTLVLLFGLVGQLSKAGLPAVVLPFAARAFAAGLTPRPPQTFDAERQP
jgi:predicted unusual protein kinase regulating ubiquinone biosynthesis (AarF/ABC1/UbiB family)